MSVDKIDATAGRENRSAERPAITEFWAGAMFAMIAVIASWSLSTDPYLALGESGSDPGPSFIPWIGTVVIGFGGLAQMVWVVLRARKTGGMRTMGEFVGSKLWLPMLLVLSLVGYYVAMPSLGFVMASIIFAIPWVAVIHWRSGGTFTKRYIVQLPLEATLIAGGIYALFAYGINVPFP